MIRSHEVFLDTARILALTASRDALSLYESRADKDWGLTDCTSFIVMKERKIEDALTVDRHFQQAGFRALLLEDCE